MLLVISCFYNDTFIL